MDTKEKFGNKAIEIQGRYLAYGESLFVEKLQEDIDYFAGQLKAKSVVLVFPPLCNKYRYLAHKTVEEFYFPYLNSFSVGQENRKRLVVGSSEFISRCCLPYKCVHEKIFAVSKIELHSVCICRRRLPWLPVSLQEAIMLPKTCEPNTEYVKEMPYKEFYKSTEKRRNNQNALRDRQKRPDMKIYVPRALRQTQKSLPEENKTKFDFEKSCTEEEDLTTDKHVFIPENELKEPEQALPSSSNIRNEEICYNKKEKKKFQLEFVKKNIFSDNSSSNLSEISCEKNEQASISQISETNLLQNQNSEKQLVPQTVIKDSNSLNIQNETSLLFCDNESKIKDSGSISSYKVFEHFDASSLDKSSNVNEAEVADKSVDYLYESSKDSWETRFDDNGECLDPEFMKDLKDITGQIDVLVSRNNYADFHPISDNNSEELDCIVELFDFPKHFSTKDLVAALSCFQQSSYSLKWIDDCHALALFSSPNMANQALMLNIPFVKIRPISEGIEESKAKAKMCARHSEPKSRPTTSAVLARRLVSGALGLKVIATKEQREQERSVINDAKEKRRLKAKQKQAIWDGNV